MRMLLKVQMDTAAANELIVGGSMAGLMQSMMERLKPEAAYFAPQDGVRTAFIFFDLEDPSQIPVISEPLFENMKAKVSFTPVMNGEDLAKGLDEIRGA